MEGDKTTVLPLAPQKGNLDLKELVKEREKRKSKKGNPFGSILMSREGLRS